MSKRLLLALFLALLASLAQAATLTASPAVCKNVANGGQAWSTASNALASDNSYASAAATVNVAGSTDILQCTGFDFSALPNNVVINGITVNVERKYSNTLSIGTYTDAHVYLLKGNLSTSDRATTTAYTSADVSETHGSASDLWDDNWTPADLKNANFGVSFAASLPAVGVASTVAVDAISVTVDYAAWQAPNLSKLASASSVVAGGVVTFTIAVSNPNAAALSNVLVSDVLPSSMTYITNASTLGQVTAAGQTVTWTLPSLPAKGSANLSIAVQINSKGVQTNTATSPGATSASAQVLVLDKAVTHYRMDEPVGAWRGNSSEVIDSGGTALHGKRLLTGSSTTTNTVMPTPSISQSNNSVSGSFCNAGYFDGNAVMVTPSSTNFQYTTQLSATAWIYADAYPSGSGSNDLASILSNDTNYEFHLDKDGHLYWWWQASTLTSQTVIPLKTWTHIAITFDSSATGGRQRIYINGVADPKTNNWQGTLTANTCPFYIGGDIFTDGQCTPATGRNFKGMIDEAKLYNYELSSSDVQADMKLGRLCNGAFDHIRLEHSGSGTICSPATVTVKACLDSACSTLYPGNVVVNLSPSSSGSSTTAWVGGDTFTLINGIASKQLNSTATGNVTIGTVSITPAPSGNTRCFMGNSETCTINFANASCAFDLVEFGAAPRTNLYTKLAGTAFKLDVLALNSNKTVNQNYTGTVHVDVIDSSATPCPSSGSIVANLGNITFANSDYGRKTVNVNSSQAAAIASGRVTVNGLAACSYDKFAIRPAAFTAITTSSATADGSGTSLTATPRVKAGTAFDLTASTGTNGYNGTPKINNDLLTAHSGAVGNGTLRGNFNTADANTGNNSGSSFTYDEVGYFKLAPNAVYDDGFTSVDASTGDCSDDFSNTLSSGRYGCKFGNSGETAYFGRFVPDHFAVSGITLTNRSNIASASSSTFTYQGEPMRLTFGLSAQNAANATTVNYHGSYAKLAVAAPSAFNFGAINGSSVLTSSLTPSCTGNCASWDKGLANPTVTLTFTRNSAPTGPYENLLLGVAPLDSDNVAFKASALDLDLDASAGNDHQQIASSKLRFGVLRLGNAYGTEVLPLRVPLEAQFWNGNLFQTNFDDNHTALAASNFLFANCQKNIAANSTCAGNRTSLTPNNLTLSQGKATLILAAPGRGNIGSADLCLDLGPDTHAGYTCAASNAAMSYLQGPWGGSSYDYDAKARVTFGLYKRNNETIYLRENY